MKYLNIDLNQFAEKGSVGFRLVTDYVKNIDAAVLKGIGLYISGGAGSGKTLLGSAVLKAGVEKGFTGHFDTLQGILDQVKEGFNSDKADGFVERLETCDILVVDKIRRIYKTEYVCVKFGEILDRRDFNRKATIFTDTEPLDTLSKVFDASICDYCIEHCIQVTLASSNFRKENISKLLLKELKE